MLKRHGRETISFQTLEPGLRHWFDGDDACVAYADTGAAWVAAGSPIASADDSAAVMQRFASAAHAASKRVRFFGVEREDFGPEFRTMLIGEQPVWDPANWSRVLSQKRSLREQLRRAKAKSVTIRQLGPEEVADQTTDRQRMDRLVARWRSARSLPPMGFLVHLDLYGHASERRFLIAERDGELCGLLVAVPIYQARGWFFEDVLRDPEAPNGTVELLLDAAMRMAAEEESHWVTYGLAPLANSRSRLLRLIRASTRWLYNFEGLRAFKAKLLPDRWQPVYLAFPAKERQGKVSAIVDTLRAFARGSLLSYGLETLRHRASLVAWTFALLLVPWIALLSIAPTQTWFPSETAKAVWIGFDMVLFCALVMLARRWRNRLATLIAVAVTADFAAGLWQTITFNASRAAGPLSWFAIALALAAPLGASTALLLCRGREEQRNLQ